MQTVWSLLSIRRGGHMMKEAIRILHADLAIVKPLHLFCSDAVGGGARWPCLTKLWMLKKWFLHIAAAATFSSLKTKKKPKQLFCPPPRNATLFCMIVAMSTFFFN